MDLSYNDLSSPNIPVLRENTSWYSKIFYKADKNVNSTRDFNTSNISYKTFLEEPVKNSLQKYNLLGNLKNSIEILNLANTSIDSNYLIEIFNCPNLKILNCSDNNFELFSNYFHIGSSKSSLLNITFDRCKIKDLRFIYALSDCTKLKLLNLSNNNFKNINFDYDFGPACNSIQTIIMKDNYLSCEKFLSKIFKFSKLNNLYLSNNSFLSISDDFKIGKAKYSLKNVDFQNCSLQNSNFFSFIPECKCIEKVDLSNNNFYSPIFLNIKKCKKCPLRSLIIKDFLITNDAKTIEYLTSFGNLRYLHFSQRYVDRTNAFTRNLPENSIDIKFGKSKKSIRTLIIDYVK